MNLFLKILTADNIEIDSEIILWAATALLKWASFWSKIKINNDVTNNY